MSSYHAVVRRTLQVAAALVLVGSFTGRAAFAQDAADPRNPEQPILARLIDNRGGVELLLLPHTLEFRFTSAESRRIEEDVARSLSHRGSAYTCDPVTIASVSGGMRAMQMIFPLESVHHVRHEGGSLTLHFEERRHRGATPFTIENVSAGEAAAFVSAFQAAKRGQ